MLLQQRSEVLLAYRVRNTPSALVVAARGTIASAAAEGGLTIEPLIRLTLRRGPTVPAAAPVAAERS